jgi:Fe2+-dicitrate sensor, membrane component
MNQQEENIRRLWQLYISNEATPEQMRTLFEYVANADRDQKNALFFEEAFSSHQVNLPPDPVAQQKVFDLLLQMDAELKAGMEFISATSEKSQPERRQTRPVHRVHLLRRGWFRYAAAAILVLTIGAYLWFNNSNKPLNVAATQPVPAKNDVAPGRDGAILTLADGRQVVLDSMGNGVIAEQSGVQVVLQDGQLAYDQSAKPVEDIAYNTMSTPKGRQFRVTLPDGTKVWLNSASSIRYPTVFSGDDRKVDITGEVYFEVAKNANKPFKVKVNDNTEIQVLGTSFTINAYDNEAAIKTTLLEGSVRINAYKQVQTLKPGQQAQITTDKKLKVVNDADVEKVIAWKNGYFNFNDADLYEVMRQLERWYDIEVVYAKPVRRIEFSGKLPRTLSLAQVLKILGEMQVKFKIEEGRKLIIAP